MTAIDFKFDLLAEDKVEMKLGIFSLIREGEIFAAFWCSDLIDGTSVGCAPFLKIDGRTLL